MSEFKKSLLFYPLLSVGVIAVITMLGESETMSIVSFLLTKVIAILVLAAVYAAMKALHRNGLIPEHVEKSLADELK